MEIENTNSKEMIEKIDAFLDEIDRVLIQRGTSRSERQSICGEVESQIYTLIERRIGSGAERNVELVQGIIESMDPPESYAETTQAEAASSSTPGAEQAKSPKRERFAYFRKWRSKIQKATSQPLTPTQDIFGVLGLTLEGVGVLLTIMGIFSRTPGIFTLGLLMLLAGAAACGISFWRIRHANGMLLGIRCAAIGLLLLPVLLLNCIVISMLVLTPLGIAVGAIGVVLFIAAANYFGIRSLLRWWAGAESQTIPPTTQTTVDADSVKTVQPDQGDLSNALS